MYYNRIDISERIDVDKSNNSKECIACHYWFINHAFKFQISICNGCHNLTMLCLNFTILLSSMLKVLIIDVLFKTLANLKDAAMPIEKALINDRLRVSKVPWKFHIPTIYNFAVIYPWNLLFPLKLGYFLIVFIVFSAYKQAFMPQ